MASTRSSEARNAGVPGGDVLEALGHRPVLGGGQHRLGALDGQRRVGGDLRGQGPGGGQHAVGVGAHVVDQADGLGPGGVDVLAGVGQLGHVALADDGGQPLQAPEVGHDGHLGLADREDWASALARRMSQAAMRSTPPPMQQPCTAAITGTGQSATAVTESCRRTDLGPLTRRPGRRPRDGGRRPLRRPPGTEHGGHGHQVEPHGEVGAPGRRPPRPGRPVRPRWRPWPRGRSAQKAGPMALRFSGRSSHRVATWPSTLDGEDVGGERGRWWERSCAQRRRGRGGRAAPDPGARAPLRTRAGPVGARALSRRPGSGGPVVSGRGSSSGPRSARGPDLPTFTPDAAAALPGPPWLSARRTAAGRGVRRVAPAHREGRGLALQPDRRAGPRPVPSRRRRPAPVRAGTVPLRAGPRPGGRPRAPQRLVVTINGMLATVATTSVTTSSPSAGPATTPRAPACSVACSPVRDVFLLLNDAFAPDPLVVDVPASATVADPVVVVHVVTGAAGGAVLPADRPPAGAGATAVVVEIVVDAEAGCWPGCRPTSAPGSPPAERLVVPVTELDGGGRGDAGLRVDAGAGERHLAARVPGERHRRRRHPAELRRRPGRQPTAGCAPTPPWSARPGPSHLRAAYLGRGDQMLDFRTLQDHRRPADHQRPAVHGGGGRPLPLGLQRPDPGPPRGGARPTPCQTNHNLVLDEGAHADSVPNLDIEENDVQCSHGSTVGPVDEDQRYYLESRGVEPETGRAADRRRVLRRASPARCRCRASGRPGGSRVWRPGAGVSR